MSEVSEARPPFDGGKGDVVLRSSDKIDFAVAKGVVAYISTFFEGMFSFPQLPESQSSEDEYKEGMVVINMPENSDVIDNLLRWVYPATAPEYKPDILNDVLQAADKYGVQDVEVQVQRYMRLLFPELLRTEPLRAFAVAYRFGLKDELLAAAHQLLVTPLASHSFFPELAPMSANAYHDLVKYRARCADAAAQVVGKACSKLDWMQNTDFVWFSSDRCCKSAESMTVQLSGRANYKSPRKWWARWMKDAMQEMKDAPSTEKFQSGGWLHFSGIKEGFECSKCGPKLFEDMQQFVDALTTQINRSVGEASRFQKSLSVRYAHRYYAGIVRANGEMREL